MMQSDDQNVATSPVHCVKKEMATTSDFCIVTEGTEDVQSKLPEVIRRVRFHEDVVPRSINIRNDEDIDNKCSMDTLQPCNSTFTSRHVPEFDDEGSLDTLDGIDSANDHDQSMSLSDLLLYAVEAISDVDEERRQHFRWSCAPRTKTTPTLESVTPR